MVPSPCQVMVHDDDKEIIQAQKRRRYTIEYNGIGNSQDGIENENHYRGINISNQQQQQQQQQQSREEVNKNGGEAINEVGIDNKNNLVVPNHSPLAGYATINALSPAHVDERNEEQNLYNVPPSVLFESLLADEERSIPTPSSITLQDVPADELFDSLLAEAELPSQEEKQNAPQQDNTSGSSAKSVSELFSDNEYNTVSDSGGEESGQEDNISAFGTGAGTSIPLGWSRMGCASGDKCTDIDCHNNNGIHSAEQSNINDDVLPPGTSSFIEGKHIHISGSFTLFAQNKLESNLKRLGASGVRTGRSLQEATILIKGANCKETLLKQAEERIDVLVLTEVELIDRLNLEGCPLITDTTDTIDESKLAKKYIDNCQFKKIRSCNDNTVVETAELEFRDPLLMMKKRQEMRQMKISVVRTKENGESDWKYHYEFYRMSPKAHPWNLYCVQHDTELKDCGHCNKCTHLDPVRGLGYSNPYRECIKCCPRIACTNCGIEPRHTRQSSLDPRYPNRCPRCYRLATGNARIEDICIEFIRNANIPISSANKEVMGLSHRPDAEITKSPLNDISYECDDEKGHIYYLVDDQHKRTVELNDRRLDEKGKVTIRQHPVNIWNSPQQAKQNQVMVDSIREYFDKDLGKRSDGQGMRVIVFIGHSRTNPHYKKAIEEKAKGYWDEVHLIEPITSNRKWFENDMSSV